MYLGSLLNLGTESCILVSTCDQILPKFGSTYTGHQLEDAGLGLIKQSCNLVQTANHFRVLSHGTSHAAGKGVAQVVVDVELARGSWGEESIVQT